MAEIDVEQIVAEIRERVARRRGTSPTAAAGPGARRAEMAADLETLQTHHDISRAPVVSSRRLVGPLLVALKRLLGALLAPFLGQQAVYNAANARFARDLADDVGNLASRGEGMARAAEEHAVALQGQLAALGDEWRDALRAETAARHAQAVAQAADLGAELSGTRSELANLRAALAAETRERQDVGERVGRVLDSVLALKDRMLRAEARLRGEPPAADGPLPDGRLDWVAFAEQFRGGEEEIRERQRVYLPYFAGQAGEVLDLGCGRGEFLELLREAGQPARGIELDHGLAAIGRGKGLAVAEDEFFAHLGSLGDASLGGVFSAQVVEHLEPEAMVALVKLVHRKLAPGAAIVLETVNPECLWTFAATFYIDPSHRRPVHAKALRFIVEAAGFTDVEVRYLAPVDPSLHLPQLGESLLADEGERERWNQSVARLNDLLFGPQDYAVIGRKG
jgi:O-antigen chain-terminating methyltransferase